MPRDVFISYSYDDKAAADKVCETLEAADIACWIAPRDELPGETWASKIVRAIDECRVMVLVFSSSSNRSKDCAKEVAIATSDDKQMPIIPLRIDQTYPTGDLRYYLAGMHRLDALPPPIENHLGRLVTDVSNLLHSLW
ncbi:MAG: toll/interleukin-1 receptor domain-containing protein, partial [Halobacteriota archaeon]